MKPLSKKKRLSYLFVLLIIFILVIPVLILYAVGYRLDNVVGFVKTGGIFVSTDDTGVSVTIDSKDKRTTNILQKSFLVSGLKSGLHEVSVTKEGYFVWKKTVPVFVEKVTQVAPFLISEKPEFSFLFKYILPDGSLVTATSTKELSLIKNKIINPDYVYAEKLFSSTTISNTIPADLLGRISTSTKYVIKSKNILFRENDKLLVRWLGATSSTPYYFCVVDLCGREIVVNTPVGISNFDFYPSRNDLVLFTTALGLYVSEVDNRGSAQNIFPLLMEKDLIFRVGNDGNIYVKRTDGIYRLEI